MTPEEQARLQRNALVDRRIQQAEDALAVQEIDREIAQLDRILERHWGRYRLGYPGGRKIR